MVDLLILVTSPTYYSLTFRKRPTKMRRFSGRLRENNHWGLRLRAVCTRASCLSRLAPSVTRVVICLSRGFAPRTKKKERLLVVWLGGLFRKEVPTHLRFDRELIESNFLSYSGSSPNWHFRKRTALLTDISSQNLCFSQLPRDSKKVSVTGAGRLRECKNTEFVWELRKWTGFSEGNRK